MAENKIHPSAFIGPQVKMGTGNFIGPFSYLNGNIQLGDNNIIHNHVSFEGNIRIGNENQFFPFSTVGNTADIPGMDPDFREDGMVIIENKNTFKSYVHIQSPMRTDETRVGNSCYFMPKAYVAHDNKIGNGVILSGGANIAGVCELGDFVNAGMGASVHQRFALGESAFLGMNATITKDILPFCIVTGSPARILKMNKRGMEKRGLDHLDLDYFDKHFKDIIAAVPSEDNYVFNALREFLNKYPEAQRTFVK
jgi:UDP-N-acetylglucosamine acyltransferase